jgi:hypothetical protein
MFIKFILSIRNLSAHFIITGGLFIVTCSPSFAQYTNGDDDPYSKGWTTFEGHVLGFQGLYENNFISNKASIFVDERFDPQLYSSRDIAKNGWGIGLIHFTRFPNLPIFWQNEFNYRESGVGFHFDRTLENESYDVDFNYNYFSIQSGIRFNPIIDEILDSKVAFLAGFHGRLGVSYDIVTRDDLTYKSQPDTLYDFYRERLMEATLKANNTWFFSVGGGYDWHWGVIGLILSYEFRIAPKDAIRTLPNSIELYDPEKNQFKAHSLKLGITYCFD